MSFLGFLVPRRCPEDSLWDYWGVCWCHWYLLPSWAIYFLTVSVFSFIWRLRMYQSSFTVALSFLSCHLPITFKPGTVPHIWHMSKLALVLSRVLIICLCLTMEIFFQRGFLCWISRDLRISSQSPRNLYCWVEEPD